jgi:carbon-monoxide dehydrogenase medium subunit
MIPAAFDYVRATSLTHAIDLLQSDPDGTKLLAGGHTLIPALKLRLASASMLIDLRAIAELRGIEVREDRIWVGALTTHADLLQSEALNAVLPIFRQAANLIADPQVRNRGTIGGSLANADPAADWPAVMIALKAEFEIASSKGVRHVAAKDFFLDIFTTILGHGEVLASIHIAHPDPGMRFTYRKIRHPASGYAVVGVAVGVHMKDDVVADVSIGVTGAANSAFEGRVAADFLIGKPLSRENIKQAARLLSESTDCLSDHYASAAYRSSLLGTETKRALLALAA